MRRIARKIATSVTRSPALLRVKFLCNNPYEDRNGHLLVFCCHHKVGTSWFGKILRALSANFGLPLIKQDQTQVRGPRAIFFQPHSGVDVATLPDYRGAHMIRDPRDVVVSGYYYHLWTHEAWARQPMKELPEALRKKWALLPINAHGDRSYQEYLNALPREQGLIAEMQRCRGVIRDMAGWNYANPRFFEFSYETLMENQVETFHRLFRHYGFHERAVERAVTLATQFSFTKLTQREPGDVDDRSHMRSGKLQQWKSEFSSAHKDYFKELYGPDLITLGYERDLDW